MEPVSVSNSLLPLLWAAKFGSHLSSDMQQWPQPDSLKSPCSESVLVSETKSGEHGHKELAAVLHRLNSSGNDNVSSRV